MDLQSQAKLVHNVAFGALIVCPVLALLPPRKMDVYTLMLLFGTGFGANQLTREYSGRSIIQHASMRMQSFSSSSELPEKARIMQERLRVEKAERNRRMEESLRGELKGSEPAVESKILTALTGRTAGEKDDKKDSLSLVDKIWMGSEGPNWKQKRDQREREALEQGKGYGDLIGEQIMEVWNWGKSGTEDIKKEDEEILSERKEGKK
jgi:hypothetical protein